MCSSSVLEYKVNMPKVQSLKNNLFCMQFNLFFKIVLAMSKNFIPESRYKFDECILNVNQSLSEGIVLTFISNS